MNSSYNLIHNIYKSYSVDNAVPMRLQRDDTQTKMDIESNNPENNDDILDAIVMCKSNSLEIWQCSAGRKGYLECCCEVNIFSNILRVFVVKSSLISQPDTLLVINTDLEYRFCQISLQGQVRLISKGSLGKSECGVISDDSIVFLSQIQVSSIQSAYCLGVYFRTDQLSLLYFSENNGKIDSFLRCQSSKPKTIQNIYNIQPIKMPLSKQQQAQSNPSSLKHVLGFTSGNYDESIFNYQHLELEHVFPKQQQQQQQNTMSNHEFQMASLSDRGVNCFSLEIEGPYLYVIQVQDIGVLLMLGDSLTTKFYSFSDKTTTESSAIPNAILAHVFMKDYEQKLTPDIQENNRVFYMATLDASSVSSLYLVSFELATKLFSLKYLGRISSPTTITLLKDNHLLVSSVDDDCKVYQITEQLDEIQESYLKTKLSLGNLSSIYSMKLLESDLNQRLLIASPLKQQSLNIFQKGMSLTVKSQITFSSAVKSVQVLLNQYMLISFQTTNLILQKTQGNLVSFKVVHEIPEGLIQAYSIEDTNACLLVSRNSLTLFDLSSLTNLNGINLSENQVSKQQQSRVILSAYDAQTLIIANSSNNLSAYTISKTSGIQQNGSFNYQLNSCASALAISGQLIAVSEWFTNHITLIDYVSSKTLLTVPIPDSKVVRSLEFYGQNKLFIGFSDGLVTLVTFAGDNESNSISVAHSKNMILGYKPVKFKQLKLFSAYCQSASPLSIACISNEVSVVNARKSEEGNQRYQKTYLNIHDVSSIDELELNNNTFIVTSKGRSVQLGGMEASSKFHIYGFGKNIKEANEFRCSTELVEMIGSMCATVSVVEDEEEKTLMSKLALHSVKSQDLLDKVILPDICVYSLLAVDELVFIAGNCADEEKQDHPQGFLYAYVIDSTTHTFQLIEKLEFKMPVMHLARYNASSIVAIVGCDGLRIYSLPQTTYQAYSVSSHLGQISTGSTTPKFLIEQISHSHMNLNSLCLDTNAKNQILVTDKMRGIQLYQELNKKIIIAAKSPFPVYSTNAKFLGEDSIMFCDHEANLMILRQNELAENDLEKIKLLVVSSINNGDIISTSLKRTVSTKDVKDRYLTTDGLEQVIYGTKKGWVGVMMSLNEQANTILQDLQESILQRHKCPLQFDYDSWKTIKNIPCSKQERSKFIDGDIIFKIMKMTTDQIVEVINGMSAIPKPSLADIEQLIENLDLLLF